MVHVADVDRSIAFYTRLGFTCRSRFGPDGAANWADMGHAGARIMFARASGRIDAAQQAVLFYRYTNDVQALRRHLLERGCRDAGPPPDHPGATVDELPSPPTSAVFTIVPRFYMPRGELRVHDPDGYCLLVGELG
ncbi:MAG: VOC family protein [Planctomycetes bacterium]|nr:VOC family protein [Planctomycetota bacterium]